MRLHAHILGSEVLTMQGELAPLSRPWGGHNDGMAKRRNRTVYKDAFLQRVAEARVAAGFTQEELASVLDLDQGTYKTYETKTLMPHDLIPRFCIAVRVSTAWLLDGPVSGIAPEMEVGNPTQERRAAPVRRGPKKLKKAAA